MGLLVCKYNNHDIPVISSFFAMNADSSAILSYCLHSSRGAYGRCWKVVRKASNKSLTSVTQPINAHGYVGTSLVLNLLHLELNRTEAFLLESTLTALFHIPVCIKQFISVNLRLQSFLELTVYAISAPTMFILISVSAPLTSYIVSSRLTL